MTSAYAPRPVSRRPAERGVKEEFVLRDEGRPGPVGEGGRERVPDLASKRSEGTESLSKTGAMNVAPTTLRISGESSGSTLRVFRQKAFSCPMGTRGVMFKNAYFQRLTSKQ